MTGSWAPWPTWVCGSRIRRWAIFSAAMIFHRLPSGSRRPVERLYPCSHGGIGGDRLLHGGSAYAQRLGYLLRVVLYPVGKSEGLSGRNHAPSGPAVDGADGAQRDDGRCWFSDPPQVPTA